MTEPIPQPTPGLAPIPPWSPPTSVPEGPTFGGAPTIEPDVPMVGVGRPTQLRQPGWRSDPDERSRVYQPGGESRYFERQPADTVLRSLFDMPKPELRALQEQLYDAGYYGNVSKDAVVFGVVDDATWKAFGGLLETTVSYNEAGQERTWFEVLDEVQRLRREQGTNLLANQGPKRAPLVVSLTNPADITRVAQMAAAEVLGQDAPPEVIARIVERYRAAEAGAQRQGYAAAETGGTVTGPPSLDTFAENEVRASDPVAAGAHDVAGRVAEDFLSIIGGPFGGQ